TAAVLEYSLKSTDATWDYAKWLLLPNDGNRYEVIDGVLYMSTAPGVRHQRCVVRLIEHVGLPLQARGVALVVPAPVGVIMPGAEPVQPDIVLIRSERTSIIADDDRIRGVPDLIAEVLSPSNPELDTVVKLAAYARAGVPEYWIVRPATRDILLYTQPNITAGLYEQELVVGPDDTLTSPTLPVSLPAAALFDDVT
ncbi:MAG: Uma2 family endonuclease, partial [Chloroflexi bacterium]